MPVNSTHPEYDVRAKEWSKCRHCFEGSESVKAQGPVYLPRLSGQSDDEYNSYKNRALFYGITAKTTSALIGMATVREPHIVNPTEMSSYFTDQDGLQFYEMWGSTLEELFVTGRVGGLVDLSSTGGKPYSTIYPTENIINWESDENDNLTLVVLVENLLSRDPDDEFKKIAHTQYRVLRLEDGVYTIQIYGDDLQPTYKTTPEVLGATINFIPFFIATPFGLSTKVVKSPILDIVNINISHYLTSADLEHGRHYTGLPTPVAIGVEASTQMHIGSGTAWVIPDPSGDAKYLEFTGQGLQSLEKALAEKQSQVASMSARFIDNSTRGSESADVVKLRFISETSSLTISVKASQSFLNSLYKTIATFSGLDPESVVITMNYDFLSSKLSATEIKALVDAYLQGGLSAEALAFNLKRGELYAPNVSIEDEVAKLVADKEEKDKEDKKKSDKLAADKMKMDNQENQDQMM